MQSRANVLTAEAELSQILVRAPAASVSSRSTFVDVDDLVVSARRRAWRPIAAAVAILATAAIGLLIWNVSVAGGPGAVGGVPIPILVLFILSALMFAGMTTIGRWNPIERRLADTHGVPIYRVGFTPFSRRMLAVTDWGMALVTSTGKATACWLKHDVTAIGFIPAPTCVILVIATTDGFHEIPVSFRVGGPAAMAWSVDGGMAWKKLEKSIRTDLVQAGYSPTASN